MKITICMGSSCFARENKKNLLIIEDFIKNYSLQDSVNVVGSLCMGDCGNGPNLRINDKSYYNVHEDSLNAILKKELLINE